MAARWAVTRSCRRRRSHAWKSSRTGRAKSWAARHSGTRSDSARRVLSRWMHRTPRTRPSRGACARTRIVRSSGSPRTLRSWTLENWLAALHATQRLRRSFRSFVDRTRSSLRHNHALDRPGWCNTHGFRDDRRTRRRGFRFSHRGRCNRRFSGCGGKYGVRRSRHGSVDARLCRWRRTRAFSRAARFGFESFFNRGCGGCAGCRRFHNHWAGRRTRCDRGRGRSRDNNLRSLPG